MMETEDDLDPWLRTPLLEPPDEFVLRVMSALPEQQAQIAFAAATPSLLGWLPAAVAVLCGAIGAVEVLLFVSGLWLRSPAAFG